MKIVTWSLNWLYLSVALATMVNGAPVEPLQVRQVGRGRIDLRLHHEIPLPGKYANGRLVRVLDIDGNGRSEIVFLDGPRRNHMSGYHGRLVTYAWADTGFREMARTGLDTEWKEVYELACANGFVWAGQQSDLVYRDSSGEFQGTIYAPGEVGLPIRAIATSRVGQDWRLMLGFVAAEHLNPGMGASLFRVMIVGLRARAWPPVLSIVGEIKIPTIAERLEMVTADLDSDGAEELLVAAPYGDTATLYYGDESDGWQLRAFASNINGARLVGAGDLDRDGDIELVVSGNGIGQQYSLWCFRMVDGEVLPSRPIALESQEWSAYSGEIFLGNLRGDLVPELIFRHGEEFTIYMFPEEQ